MVYVIVIVLAIIILLVLIFFGALWGLSSAHSPDSRVGSLKSFLGYDFKGEYNIVESHSQPFHPDQPMRIAITLSDEQFDKVKMYLQTLEFKTTETHSSDGRVLYRVSWIKASNIFTKSHTALYIDTSLPFFNATLEIDCNSNVLRYRETRF